MPFCSLTSDQVPMWLLWPGFWVPVLGYDCHISTVDDN